MNLREKDFLIAIADGRATPEEQQQYEQLRAEDPRAELYVAVLRAARERVRAAAHAHSVEVPSELLQRIRNHIEQEKPQARMLPLQRWWWAIAAAAAIIAVVFITSPWNPWKAKPVDFRAESMQNFERIVQGKLTVAKATSNFDELVKFFREQGVTYQLINLPLKAELVGGVVSEHNGVKLAHFVYRRGSTIVYLYQAPQELFERGVLSLPQWVEPYARSGKWYTEQVASNSWMFWRIQSVYCSLVANVPPDVLATYFVEGSL